MHWLMRKFPFSGQKKVLWFIGRREAQLIWTTLLEPRHKALRIPLAIFRAKWHWTRSVLGALRRPLRNWFGAEAAN
jgi:hypothetical protein